MTAQRGNADSSHIGAVYFHGWNRVPLWSSSSVLDHKSLPPMFESRCGHIWNLFHIWLRFITFWGRSAHLAYHMHKSGRKAPIIIHGWNTIVMKGSCSVSHAESYHYMQIIPIFRLNRWKHTALLCSSKIKQELHPTNLQDTRLGQAVI